MVILAGLVVAALLFHLNISWFFRSNASGGGLKTRKLERYLPDYHIAERHEIPVNASPEKAFEAVWLADMRESRIISAFIALRSLFSLRAFLRVYRQGPATLSLLTEHGFSLLEATDNEEIIIGFGGKVWTAKPKIIVFADVAEFTRFAEPGYIKALWNIFIERHDENKVTLFTETRVLCLGQGARFFFRLYWWVISPYSAWIRMELLKIAKKQAERAAR